MKKILLPLVVTVLIAFSVCSITTLFAHEHLQSENNSHKIRLSGGICAPGKTFLGVCVVLRKGLSLIGGTVEAVVTRCGRCLNLTFFLTGLSASKSSNFDSFLSSSLTPLTSSSIFIKRSVVIPFFSHMNV